MEISPEALDWAKRWLQTPQGRHFPVWMLRTLAIGYDAGYFEGYHEGGENARYDIEQAEHPEYE